MTAPRLEWPLSEPTSPPVESEIHLWAVAIDEVETRPAELWFILAEDERARAERFRFDEPRDRYVAARAALRRLLAAYLGLEPGEVRFSYDAYGKPALDPRVHSSELRFNVAHSGGLAMIAVTAGCDVGCDVECLRAVRQAEGISERYFHPHEAAEVLSAASDALIERFFCCWTRKEAVIKAIGTGLQYPLEQFRVPVLSDKHCWIDLPASAKSAATRVWLQPCTPCGGYLGAVATLAAGRVCDCKSLAL